VRQAFVNRTKAVLNYPDAGASEPYSLRCQNIGGGGEPFWGASGPIDDDELDTIFNTPPEGQVDRDHWFKLDGITQVVLEASQPDPPAPIGQQATFDEFLTLYGYERTPEPGAQAQGVVLSATTSGTPNIVTAYPDITASVMKNSDTYPLAAVMVTAVVSDWEAIDEDNDLAILYLQGSNELPLTMIRPRYQYVSEVTQNYLVLYLISRGMDSADAEALADNIPAFTTRYALAMKIAEGI
jgi:hypothetical protein